MKKETVFETADGKKLRLSLNIRDMMEIERDIDCSLFALMTEVGMGSTRNMTVRFTASVLRHAMPKGTTEEEVEKLIEEHCYAGGTLDGLNAVALNTILRRGCSRREKSKRRRRRSSRCLVPRMGGRE